MAVVESTSMLGRERGAVFTLSLLYMSRMLGLFMVLPIFALYLSDYEGFTLPLLGWALGIYGATQACLQVPFGLLSDRIGRKPVIVIGLVLFILGSLLAAMADSVMGIILGRALQGAGAISSTVMALVSDVTREEVRSRAMAMIGASIGLSFALAMVIGPAVGVRFGLQGVFVLTAIIASLGLVLVFTVIKSPKVASPTDALPTSAMFKRVLADGQLLRYNFGIFCLHMVLTAGFIVIPDIVINTLGVAPKGHGLTYLMVLGGAFIAMLPLMIMAEKKGLVKPIFLAAIAVMAVAACVMAFGFSSSLWFVVGWFAFFIGFNLLEAMLPSSVSKQVVAGGKGTAMGIYSTCQFGGVAIGGVVGGVVAETFGTQGLFLFVALVLCFWLLVAITMSAPRKAKTLVVQKPSGWSEAKMRSQLDTLKGVIEVTWFDNDAVAYIKINPSEFEEDQMAVFR